MSTTVNGLRTPSLRRRVTVVVLLVVASMLVGLALVTDLVLRERLDAQLRQRLTDRAAVAAALVDKVGPRDLSRRLEGDGVSVVLDAGDGQVYAEGPLAGRYVANSTDGSDGSADPGSSTGSTTGSPTPRAAPEPPGPGGAPPTPKKTSRVVQSGELLSVRRSLPGGVDLLLIADARSISTTLDQARLAFGLAALLALLVASVSVPLVVTGALRPLTRITEVARTIGRGDRGRRLNPTHPGSELGRTAQAFDEMLDDITGAEARARRSEERLRAFLSDAAHELRTPLTGVLSAAEHVLRDSPDRHEREQVLLGLIRETQRASRLVEDLLTMARIDRGLELEHERVDLRQLAEQVVSSRRLAPEGERLEVRGQSVVVTGDRDRLVQVVANLVDNAQRHGGDHVVLTTRSLEGDAVLDVDDDGHGVPDDDRERIFERLVRLDTSRVRSEPHTGSGLGLTIARGIAVAHAGSLACPPTATGARFRLRIPASTGE